MVTSVDIAVGKERFETEVFSYFSEKCVENRVGDKGFHLLISNLVASVIRLNIGNQSASLM